MEIFKRCIKSLIIGSSVGLGIALLTTFFFKDFIDRIENVTYYLRYRWKYSESSATIKSTMKKENDYGICLVDIDERSMQKMGPYWNWDRGYQAELINKLSAKFPAAILYDILFGSEEDGNQRNRLDSLFIKSARLNRGLNLDEQTRHAILSAVNYDEAFVEATRKAKCVYHGICLSDERDYRNFAVSQVKHKMTSEWHEALNPASAVVFPPEVRTQIKNRKTIIDGIFPRLAQAARAIGHVDIVPSEDGIIRETPLLYRFGDFNPVYLPLSVRAVATLFGTPNDEIEFVPGRYVDIGSPFKVLRDSKNTLLFSYPNVTEAQVRAIIGRSSDILNLEPGKQVEITSLLYAQKHENGCVTLEMNVPGTIPCVVTDILAGDAPQKALLMRIEETIQFDQDIAITRESEDEWVIVAPFDAGEWYFTKNDLATLSIIDTSDFVRIKPGEKRLIFHQFTVRASKNGLTSSLPVLRDETLRQLCRTDWNHISSLSGGSRIDFGKQVRIPLTNHNYHIITFFGPQSVPFESYSFYDLYTDRVQASLAGKIFLVGSTAPALFDIKAVPHDRSYPAVEIHASLINSFLTGNFVHRLDRLARFLVLLSMGIVVGFVSFFFRPLPGVLLAAVFLMGYFLIAITVFNADYLWIEVARPALVMIATFTAVMAYRYITEEKDRKFLHDTFKQYLSPEVIDSMYKSKRQPLLGGDEGIRTAFFTDIQGFSSFSEKLGSPTRLVSLLNEYLGAMTDILLEHCGTLDKYEGDAIIAFFGAPVQMEDHAAKACITAVTMQKKLEELRKKWSGEGEKWPEMVKQMRMRIGINTGSITTGNMGSPIRKNYTMMGDAVNLAARLESAAKQYGIYTMISENTYCLVEKECVCRQLDKIMVMGKSEPVIVYELMALKSDYDGKYTDLLSLYNCGLNYFYLQEWNKAVECMVEAEKLEPNRDFSPKGMTPSKKIIEYCTICRLNPPDSSWDGVTRLSSK